MAISAQRTARTIRLPKGLNDRLEAEHSRTHVPRQKLIELALDAYLPKLARKRPNKGQTSG